MTFNWTRCEDCDRKYLPSQKEKHYEKFHNDDPIESEETRDVKEDIPSIPFIYNDKVKKLLKKSKLQVIRQKPQLMVKVAPFIHHSVELNDDIAFEIGKTYIIKEKE
jgi:hypothetical protein